MGAAEVGTSGLNVGGGRVRIGLQVLGVPSISNSKGKNSTKFFEEKDLPEVHKQLKNYECMKLLMDKWIDLAMALLILRLAKEIESMEGELVTVQPYHKLL